MIQRERVAKGEDLVGGSKRHLTLIVGGKSLPHERGKPLRGGGRGGLLVRGNEEAGSPRVPGKWRFGQNCKWDGWDPSKANRKSWD